MPEQVLVLSDRPDEARWDFPAPPAICRRVAEYVALSIDSGRAGPIGRRVVTIAASVAALLASASLLNITAAADDKLPFGGGAGIIVDGSYCTLTTIGHDNTGELVGFTAAHCGGPGAQVVAEVAEDHGTLGTVATANGGLDYSVIKFDPGKVTPIANFAGFTINGIGPDESPAYRQPACKLGAATGNFCSGIVSLPGPGPRMSMSGLFQPGDDGGPVTSDGLLIGMIRDGYVIGPGPGNPLILGMNLTTFSAILADVNTNGGPGAGFTPVPN